MIKFIRVSIFVCAGSKNVKECSSESKKFVMCKVCLFTFTVCRPEQKRKCAQNSDSISEINTFSLSYCLAD